MRKSKDETLQQFAGLVASLLERRETVREMKRIADEIQRGGIIVVTGEATIIRNLEERLVSAAALLGSLSSPGSANQRSLEEFEARLETVEWAVVPSLQKELRSKLLQQADILRPFLDQLTKWRSLIDSTQQLLGDGLKARAPIFAEQRSLQRYEACVTAAERALREQQYRSLIQSLGGLPPDFQEVESIRALIRDKINNTGQISRQADLLLLRSPLDAQHRRYQYTMLLRTASEPGSHGVNIQDSSTLVEQDRSDVSVLIKNITEAIDRGLALDFAQRKAGLSSAPTPASVGGNPESASAASESVSRRFVVGDTGPESSAPDKLNVLLQEMGDMMFRLLMPEWTHQYLKETSCSVMITTNDLELPWELMYCNGNYLCLDRPMSRMPMGRSLPRVKPKAAGLAARKIRFLLIYSDPDKNLPAAKAEIETLEKYLREEWGERIDVDTLFGSEATGARLNKKLRSGSFDVIHYAGHAYFDESTPELSGLQLCDRDGKPQTFYAQKVRRLLEGRPLVFLNACQSGRAANEETAARTDYLLEPAEGLASAFLYGGALACIGSLWPIFDKPAAEFATEFYHKALEGYMLGEAMRLARVQIREKYPEQVTWAAFALYGDGTFRLAH
jgi:hypothetical protein